MITVTRRTPADTVVIDEYTDATDYAFRDGVLRIWGNGSEASILQLWVVKVEKC